VVGNKVVYAAFFASGQGKQGIFKQGKKRGTPITAEGDHYFQRKGFADGRN
jgi:hypothetical protein